MLERIFRILVGEAVVAEGDYDMAFYPVGIFGNEMVLVEMAKLEEYLRRERSWARSTGKEIPWPCLGESRGSHIEQALMACRTRIDA